MKCQFIGCGATWKRERGKGKGSRYCAAHFGCRRNPSTKIPPEVREAQSLCECGKPLYLLKNGRKSKRCKDCNGALKSYAVSRISAKRKGECLYGCCPLDAVMMPWSKRAVYCAEHATKYYELRKRYRAGKPPGKRGPKKRAAVGEAVTDHPPGDLGQVSGPELHEDSA